MKMWNGKEAVAIAKKLLHSPHFLQPVMPPVEQHGGAGHDSTPFESYAAGQMAEDGDDDEEDVYKNWRPPKQNTDFALHAGQSEKAVLLKLGFNLMLRARF